MIQRAYTRLFDRLHEVGLGGDHAHRSRTIRHLERSPFYQDDDPAFARMSNMEFRLIADIAAEAAMWDQTEADRREARAR